MQGHSLESRDIIVQNREVLRGLLASRVAKAGPRPDKPVNALFWLDRGEIGRIKNGRIDMLMRTALSDRSSEDQDIFLLRDLAQHNIPTPTLRTIAARLVEKDFEATRQLHTDELTGLFSRGFAIRAMEELLESYLLGGSDTSIGFIDIENLNKHNEGSYDFGNGAMQAVAYVLQETGNIAARFFSGDEDLLIMPSMNSDNAKDIILDAQARLPEATERVRKENLRNKKIGSIPITFRYGYTSFNEALEYFVENSEDLSLLNPDTAIDRIVDITIGIAQTFERMQKASVKGLNPDTAMEDLVGKYGDETHKLLQFCSKRNNR